MSITLAHANVRRAWMTAFSVLPAFALLANVSTAQDAQPNQPAQDQPQDPAARRPIRTKGRGPQRSRPADAQPQPQENAPAPQPTGQPGEEEITDEQLQQEVQELLKNQAPGQEMDPAVQKRIEELLQRKARNARSRANQPAIQPADPAQPTQIQPIQPAEAQAQPPPDPNQPQNQPPQPDPNQAQPGQPDPAQPGQAQPNQPRPSPRELARQRAEERRKQREAQQTQPGMQPQPQPQPMQPQDNPPLPQPVQSFQPQPSDAPPSGPTTQINIPRDETEKIPAEERTYSFSIKNGTYEQLIEGFARQTGIAIQGEIPQGGTVNFVTTEEMSFKEALSKIQMQLFNYRPHEPYWMLRNEENLQVIRVTDLYRIIPKDRVFPSLEAYQAAGLDEDEIVLMFFTPKSGSIGDLMMARNFLPDYVRITPLQDQNGVAIFALVRDIERFLDFVELVSGASKGSDPRLVERIPLTNIPASDALNKLNQLMGPMDVGGQRMVRPPVSGQPTGLEGVSEPAVSIIADDEQNVLIVRAVPKTVDEIKRLLPFIDVTASGDSPAPVIIPLKHTTADAIIPVIQQMLTANPAAVKAVEAAPMPGTERRPRRGRTTPNTMGGSTAVATESVMMIPHPSGSAIIVTAHTEADIGAVRKLVEMVDVPIIVEWIHIPITNTDPEAVRDGVEEILGGGTAMPKQPGDPSGFQLFVDPTGSGIWFSGPEKELDRVRSIVEKLDVTTGAVTLHRIRLEYQTPTFVSNMLREMEGAQATQISSPGAAPPATPQDKPLPRGGSRRGLQRSNAPAAAGKFTPDDPSGILYVICTEQEWKRYLGLIEQLDQPNNPGAPFVRIGVEHVDAETAVEKLSNMIGANPDALGSEIRLVPANKAILVMGASEREREHLRTFLQEVDLPAAIEQRTFIIQHADPGEIKTLIEAFVADSHEVEGRPRRPRPSPRQAQPVGEGGVPQPAVTTAEPTIVSPEMTIVELGNKLIVRASPDKLEEIAALVKEFDLPGGGTEIRVYQDFPPTADIENIANTVESVVTGGAPGVRRGGAVPQPGAGAAPPSPKFIPQPNSGRLIVVASPTDFPRIEELLKVLRFEIKDEQFVVEFIPVQFVNPEDLVDQIQPVLEIKVRGLLQAGELADPAMAVMEDPAAGAQGTIPARRRVNIGGAGGDKTANKYHLSPDSRNKRIVVAAPKRIVEEVRTLISQFDLEGGKSEVVFRTVELQNTAPAEMIQAVKEMMGKPQASRVNRVKRATGQAGAVPSPAPAAVGGETATGESLTIVEAPGGGAIVLHGVLADVEQATEWIHKLDAMASTGRLIKAYKIDYADVEMLFGMIVNVVDSSPAAPAASGAQRAPARALPKGKAGEEELAEEEEPEFTTVKTHNSGDLYIHADLIGNTLLVATTQAKINQIENVLEQFKTDPEIGIVADAPADVPMRVFDLKFAEASDADYEFDDVFAAVWKGKDRPRAKVAPFGNALLVEYPDESRFPEIADFIVKYVDVRDEEKLEFKKRGIPAPQGISARQLAEYIKNNMPGIDVEIFDESTATETYGIEEVLPNGGAKKPAPAGQPATGRGAPCVLPGAFEKLAANLLVTLPAQSEEPPPEEEEQGEPAQEDQPQQEEPEPEPVQPQPTGRSDFQDRLIRERLNPPSIIVPLNQPADQPAPQSAQTPAQVDEKEARGESAIDESKYYEGEKLIVRFDEKTGTVKVEGPKGPVDEIDDLIDELKKEIEELTLPPDIRIVRVRHIDVYTAQDILEEMFNATRQQRQELQNVQRQQQQMQRQQQQLQQQQAKQQGQRGGEDEKQRQQQQQQQPQMEVPQLPAASVRVYPNPRDRTLILRADTSQYPEIFKLLATIDQPKPFDSFMRVFPLKKLNAKEVETILRDMLNLGQGGGTSRRTPRANQAGEFGGSPEPASGPGSALPESILQPTREKTNLLGIDPEDIKLFASEPSNSIMAMAPPEALNYIKKIIDDLESGDIPNRVTRFYQLQHAAAQDVVDYLATHFGDATKAPRAPRGEGGAPATTAAGGGTANAPAFIAYSQLNQLTVQATEPQIPEIEEIIKRLDVETGETWRDVRVNHVDAADAAETLNEMFGGGAAGSGARAPGAGTTGGGRAQFIGEPGGNIIFFSAPQNLHQQILDNVAKLDKESEKQDQIRVIELQFAVPSTVAEAIDKAYQDTGAASRRTGGTPAGKAFTVTAHDQSGRLFIKASDTLYAEIESLVKSLDQPGEMPEFRIYPLEHANAKSVHAHMTNLLQEYMGRMKGELSEAFSVQVDETANALIVLGGPMVFGFLEENLRKIDTPAAGTGKVVSETITLEFNDAADVAANLQRLYQGRALPEGVEAPQIEANRQNNTLIIRATSDQIAEMRRTVIEPLEAAGPKSQGGMAPVETIKLTYADPASVADAIGRLFRSDGRNPRDVVTATPELGANALLVAAYPHMMQRVKNLIAQIDIEDAIDDGVHVVELRYADPESVARTLNEIYVQAAKQRAGQQGTQLSVSAVPGSQALVVRASDAEFKRISGTIAELDIEGVGIGEEVRMITLQFSDAGEVHSALQEYLRKATGGRDQLAGDVRLTAMPQANAIMVAAKKEEVDRLETIIKNMDIVGEKGTVPQIIPLKYANASMMATSLEAMFSKPFGTQGRNYSPPVISADETGNFLIVRAVPADLGSIEGLIAKMDTEDKKDQTPYKIIPVPAGWNVEDLAEHVETTINETAEARALGVKGATVPRLTVRPDRRSSTITIAGSAELFADAEAMIKQFSDLGPAGGMETRVVKVPYVSRDEIDAIIQQLTQPPGERESRGGRRSSQRQPGGNPGGGSGGGGSRRERQGAGRP